jgi:formate dehydrogenase maturation protein FdhE
MWHLAVARAERLAAEVPGAVEILRFYATLLHAQSEVDRQLRRSTLSGNLTGDLPAIRSTMITLLRTVAGCAPQRLGIEARALLSCGAAERDERLLNYWCAPSDDQFFAKAFLQPYTYVLTQVGVRPAGRHLPPAARACPFCAGRPQLSVLAPGGAEAPPGRSLVCATCLTTWPFPRVLCAHCGEEREDKLPYFHSPDHDAVRVEACDTCRRYLKGIDLSRNGLAVPLVDEVASAVLDVWAREKGYAKIELNLVGM